MNNKSIALVLSTALLCASPAHAEGWLESLKNMLGFGTSESQQEQAPVANIEGLMESLKSLGVTESQIQGGLAAIMNFVANNISSEQFGQLAEALPGSKELLDAVPDISQLESGSGLSGLLDKASEYSETLKAANDVKKQFEVIGLSPDMIGQYSAKIQEYLDTPEGAQAKQIIQDSLGKLLG
ncbi:DUF2780 domain-containing protein [Thalassotalea euphylliae]|uniref:DUF2780 domain-containing protein n=1 Tax=Thalassotalea euphylliae TaxID=1655234 RepID=A0A3E0TSM5_9GAMM|nr:DUF2780 domain-containing protein [Thalassotalea euphylliae]REL27400.1 DUF2780 domain-containing protein [Thalassotalea euphylliae]